MKLRIYTALFLTLLLSARRVPVAQTKPRISSRACRPPANYASKLPMVGSPRRQLPPCASRSTSCRSLRLICKTLRWCFTISAAAQGGSVQANIERWINQIKQPDGSSSQDKAKTETATVNGLKVTTVDVTGTYTAEMTPGGGDRHNDEKYRLACRSDRNAKRKLLREAYRPGQHDREVGAGVQRLSEIVRVQIRDGSVRSRCL